MNEFLQDNWISSPWAWALVTGACALWCLIPKGRLFRWQIAAGGVLGVVSLGLLASRLPIIQPVSEAATFWLVAAVSVVSAAATISMRSPVYCAIWFAMTLLGTACLFLLQGAQFLAVATIVVYAGAIVVMFLFLIMLAQPEGHEYYDRMSWSSPAAWMSSIAGAAMVLMLTTAVVGLGQSRDALRQDIAKLLPEITDEDEPVWRAEDIHSVRLNRDEMDLLVLTLKFKQPAEDRTAGENHVIALRDQLTNLSQLQTTDEKGKPVRPSIEQVQIVFADKMGTQADQHVATLGGVLFSQYLIAVEVAGTLLLIALVGAVSIVMHGREQERGGRRTESTSNDPNSNDSGSSNDAPPSSGGDA